MATATAHQIVEWAKTKGEVKAADRIRLLTVAVAIREGVDVSALTPQTDASDTLLDALRQAATTVVGESCPF